jgi:hypothetical protein
MSGKRLAIYLIAPVVIYLLGIFVVKPLLPDTPQEANMKRVRAHIKSIDPSWERFKATNAGFDLVWFWPDTRTDGLFGVRGYLTSQVQVAQLLTFITSTCPPRPLYTDRLRVVDAESFEFYKAAHIGTNSEPGGAANRSQPVGSQTNRTPSAAGSGR